MIKAHRLRWAFLALIAATGISAAGAGARTQSVLLFSEGQARLPIVTPADPAPEEMEAAQLLARVLGVAGGVAFRIETESASSRRGIFVGDTRAAARLLPSLESGKVTLDRDGFRIVVLRDRVFIQGAEPWGTRFAASWFLQRHAGVRWFAPGAIGEVIARVGSLSVPVRGEVREPAFASREFWGVGPGGETWAALNGLRRRFAFSHNLVHVYPPEVAEAHPDWFPIIDGGRIVPAQGDYRWQPDLSRDDVARHAAGVASRHFEANPGDASFALGMNDSVRFDQSDATRAVVEPMRWFRGFPDYSDLVFGFMNRAAAALDPKWSDKRLGALAYFWCENTPQFLVDSKVLPYLTTDRSQFYDAEYRAADLALMRAWRLSGAANTGIYDYSYGSRFLVPRIYHRSMVDSLNAARAYGVEGYFAEMNSHWGFDAFKAWATSRILWDGEADLAALEAEFFNGFYGSAAAGMRRFFALCESRWMGQGGPPYWLKFYDHEDQALLFPKELCDELRQILSAAKASAADSETRERVELTSRAFAVTEAFVAFDTVRREMMHLSRDSAADGSKVETVLRDFAGKRDALTAAFAAARTGEPAAMSDMPLDPFLRNDPRPTIAWKHLRSCVESECSHLSGYSEATGIWAAVRSLADSPAPNLAANGSFELEGERMKPEFLFPRYGALPVAWRCQAMPTERGRVAIVKTDAVSGARALRIEGAWDTEVFRWIPAQAGKLYVLTGWLRGRLSQGNTSALVLSFLGEDNKPVGDYRVQSLPVGDTMGWTELILSDRAPTGAAWVGFGISVARQVPGDHVEVDELQLRSVNSAPSRG